MTVMDFDLRQSLGLFCGELIAGFADILDAAVVVDQQMPEAEFPGESQIEQTA